MIMNSKIQGNKPFSKASFKNDILNTSANRKWNGV